MLHSSPSPADLPLLVISRFRVDDAGRAQFLADAATAMDVLAAQAGCHGVSLGQSTDEPGLLVLRSEWAGVGAYRRALSSFDVKVNAVPLLSMSIDEPSAYELVRRVVDGEVSVGSSGLAADADAVELGEASAPSVPSVTS